MNIEHALGYTSRSLLSITPECAIAFCVSNDCEFKKRSAAEIVKAFPDVAPECSSYINFYNIDYDTGFAYPVDAELAFAREEDERTIFAMFLKRFWNQPVKEIGKYEYLGRIEHALTEISEFLTGTDCRSLLLPDLIEESDGLYAQEIYEIIRTVFGNTDYTIIICRGEES